MKRIVALCIIFNIILSLAAVQLQKANAATAYTVNQQTDMDDTWSKVAVDAASDIKKWTFVPGNAVSPGWAEYTDYNSALSVEKSSEGVYSDVSSLSGNPRGRTGIYHKSVQANNGGRILQFTGGGYKNFAVTFDIQAVNTWKESSERKAIFDFGLIDDALPVSQLQSGYAGQNYIRLDGSVDMQKLTLPSGAAGKEISPRAAVINTKAAADYPDAAVVTKTDALTNLDYIESITENGSVTYYNQVINCKIVADGDVMSIYMKFEDADSWKHIISYSITSLQDIKKRFYLVCGGYQMLVSNFDIWCGAKVLADDFEYVEGTALHDDFKTDDLFWDTTKSDDPMRIENGVFMSDNGRTKCFASTNGRLWDNFCADINFSFLTNTDGNFSNGYVKFSVRDDGNKSMSFMINPDSIAAYRDGVRESSIAYKFIRNERYDLKIMAQSKAVTLYVKPQSEEEYTCIKNYQYDGQQAGKIKIETYHEKVGIYDFKVSDLNKQDFYFADSFVKIKPGTNRAVKPISRTGKEVKSVSYSSSNPDYVSVNESSGRIVCGSKSGVSTITALITASNGSTYTASYDAARVIPLTSFAFSKKHITLRVGETMNVRIDPNPSNVSNKQLIWTTDSPECIELVGDTELSRGIRALAPKMGITVTATSVEEADAKDMTAANISGSFTIDVIEQSSGSINRVFNLSSDAEREIPYYFWGAGTPVGGTRNSHLPYLRQIKPMSLRTCTSGLKTEDMFYMADQMDIPLVFATSMDDTPQQSIEAIRAAKEHTGDKTVFVEIMNEPYHLSAAEKVPTVQDYMSRVKIIYNAVKQQYGDGVKIGVSLLPYENDIVARASYEASGGKSSVRFGTWNTYIRDNPDSYDAVILHSYSSSSMNMTTADDLMEEFSQSCALEEAALALYREEFEGKDFWFTEYGDLPGFLLDNPNTSLKSRLQYMKSVGNSVGYIQKLFTLMQNNEVTMAAHHAFYDSQGFGIVDVGYKKLPNFYTYEKIGDMLDKYSYLYSLTPESVENDEFRYSKDIQYAKLDIQRLSAWALGDEQGAKEAIFVNTSANAANVSIPSKSLKKKWYYGASSYGGSNPLPDFAVDSAYWAEAPDNIPLPDEGEEPYSDTLEIPPYSVVIAQIGGMQLRFSDVSYDLDEELIYYDVRTSTYSGPAHLFTAVYENGKLSDLKLTEINIEKDKKNEFSAEVRLGEGDFEIHSFIFKPDWSLRPLSPKNVLRKGGKT